MSNANADDIYTQRTRPSNGRVILRFVAITVVAVFLQQILSNIFAGDAIASMNELAKNGQAITPDGDFTREFLNEVPALWRSSLLITAFSIPLYGFFFTKVGYRWIDGLLTAIPFVSLWFTTKLFWRLAHLPYRYWSERNV